MSIAVAAVATALAAAAVWLTWRDQTWLLRWLLWLPAHLLYRIRVHGRERLPATGPVLLVCNHVSFVDAFLVLLAQNRPVRLMIWGDFFRVRWLRGLFRLARVIPVEGTDGLRPIVRALLTASQALKRGEVVCIFAVGGRTSSGIALPFHRGYEFILARTPVPVVPVSLDHVWGTLFNFHGGRFLWKWPQMLPYPVSVAFGEPMPATASAFEVRQAIQLLSAKAAVARKDTQLPVHRQFVRMAARHPFRRCVVDPIANRRLRYGAALAGAIVMRNHLAPLLGNDEMVGIWLPPGAGAFLANLALTLMRRTSVNLNYTSSPLVVASAIRQCNIRTVITARPFTARVKLEVPEGVELVYLDDVRAGVRRSELFRTLVWVLIFPAFVLDRWLGLHRHKIDDLATVIFSSGSTGDPKGVMLSHANLIANAESVIQGIDPRPEDRLLGVLPLFHSFGYTVTFWLPLQVGASLVYYADPRQAKEIGELCKAERCTLLLMTPTFLRFCLRRCGPDDFRTLRILICGAEKLPTGLADEFEARFGVRPLEGYGCTELSPVVSANVPDWELGGLRQVGNKVGTIGQPLPGIATRVRNPDTGALLGLNQPGVLEVFGGNVMVGYLGRPDATGEVVRDDWYVTGDIGLIDEEGFVTLTDRLSRFSKVAGEMVPHQRVEDELHILLSTTERVCVVTGVPDERRGERLIVLYAEAAFNGRQVGPLWKELMGRGLPNLWLPGERDFYPIAEVPVLGSGKLDLKRVKELALERVRPGPQP